MSNIKELQSELIEEFELFDDWMEKYEHIITLGKELPIIDDAYKVDENLIKGCQSRVWLQAEPEGDRVRYKADSDAIITKGIVALLIRVLDNQKAEDIIAADMSFLDQIGLKEHLSPTRANGLVSMVKQMKAYALAYSVKQ